MSIVSFPLCIRLWCLWVQHHGLGNFFYLATFWGFVQTLYQYNHGSTGFKATKTKTSSMKSWSFVGIRVISSTTNTLKSYHPHSWGRCSRDVSIFKKILQNNLSNLPQLSYIVVKGQVYQSKWSQRDPSHEEPNSRGLWRPLEWHHGIFGKNIPTSSNSQELPLHLFQFLDNLVWICTMI